MSSRSLRTTAILALGTAAAVAVGSCTFDESIYDLRFTCDASTECGSRFECVNGMCEFKGDSGCVNNTPEVCNDNFDNNCDLVTDCEDPVCDTVTCGVNGMVCASASCGCSGNGSPPESPEQSCADAVDNDCDGLTDCADPDCDRSTCDVDGRLCLSGACVGYVIGTSPQPFVNACAQPGAQAYLDAGPGPVPLDDKTSGVLPMPFQFKFFNKPVGEYWLSDNGTLGFSNVPSTSYSFSCLPTGTFDLPALYPLRDDLKYADAVCVATTGVAPDRKLVVTWSQLQHYNDGGNQTFSVVLHETTDFIDFVYQTMTGTSGATALVGIQGWDAGIIDGGFVFAPYAQRSCKTATVPAGTALRFTP